MDEFIAYCGLICEGCPIYWASRETNKEKKEKMRSEIARIINKHYELQLDPIDITDCDGCRSEGSRLFSVCRDCLIRKCAKEKGLKNCAYCEFYPCENLKKFFVTAPAAQSRLDVIKSTL